MMSGWSGPLECNDLQFISNLSSRLLIFSLHFTITNKHKFSLLMFKSIECYTSISYSFYQRIYCILLFHIQVFCCKFLHINNIVVFIHIHKNHVHCVYNSTEMNINLSCLFILFFRSVAAYLCEILRFSLVYGVTVVSLELIDYTFWCFHSYNNNFNEILILKKNIYL